MKKIYSLLLLVITSVSFGQTVYTENFGTTAPSTSPYPLVTAYTGYQAIAPIAYTGTSSARASGTLSTGYSGASGASHIYMGVTAAVGQTLQIDGINTSAYTAANLQLAFGYLKNGVANPQLVVETSTNGTTWTPVTFTDNTTTAWTLVTIGGGQIPASATLSLRFTNPSTTSGQIRLDDVKVSNVNASCTLSLGVPSVLCDATTLALDTYTATVAYTGGTAGAYTITPSSGTVGGDNPATVAAGNIIVTGITEGTNFTLNVTKGACSYDTNANSPECKAVNPLPYNEHFNYTVGSSLGTSQSWSNLNSGDDIVSTAGNLTYTGVTSSGNSVTFGAAGKECTTPFTSATSGTLYAAFLLNVSDVAAMTDGSGGYLAGICGISSADYKGRIFVKRIGTQYSIGFDIASTTTNYETTLRNVGETVSLVIGYDFTGNALSLWINPANGSAPTLGVVPTTPLTALGWFTFRQDDAGLTPVVTADELRIVTSVAELGLTLGVKESNIAGLKMYPNPVSNGTLFIETAANAEKTVAVYDVLGKQVLNTTTADTAINVAGLHAGVYIVNITEEGKTATRKLVIR